ncbi:MAG: hypothetical protein COB71_02635 [Thiotrichales bacterium]|nr:MAG: hypothetical protein COB71_02635 [Thiotrichales bacterium]
MVSIRLLARKMIAFLYYCSGKYRLANRGRVIILMYHRILEDDDVLIASIQPGMYVTRSSFERQMAYVNKYYEITSLEDLTKMWACDGFDRSKAYCVVTFDDGWRDNYLNAFDILKKYNIPATIFLATEYIDTGRRFWHETLVDIFLTNNIDRVNAALSEAKQTIESSSALQEITDSIRKVKRGESVIVDELIESLKKYSSEELEAVLAAIFKPSTRSEEMLNWNEIKEMGQQNISFGSHTCNHEILTNIPLNKVQDELQKSGEELQGLDSYIPVFCYPNGNYNDDIQRLVSESGYVAAVTTQQGAEVSDPLNLFALKRVGVHEDISSTNSLFSYLLARLN